MSKKQAENNNDSEIDSEDMDRIYNLDNTFFTNLEDTLTKEKNEETHTEQTATDAVKTTFSREQLIKEQQKDPEVMTLAEKAIKFEDVKDEAECLYTKDGLLMRKWRPPEAGLDEDWRVVHQIIIPRIYRKDILSLAHDSPMAGHLGINKTYSKILNHFYWPKMKQDVKEYLKSCHVCQMVGKPN